MIRYYNLETSTQDSIEALQKELDNHTFWKSQREMGKQCNIPSDENPSAETTPYSQTFTVHLNKKRVSKRERLLWAANYQVELCVEGSQDDIQKLQDALDKQGYVFHDARNVDYVRYTFSTIPLPGFDKPRNCTKSIEHITEADFGDIDTLIQHNSGIFASTSGVVSGDITRVMQFRKSATELAKSYNTRVYNERFIFSEGGKNDN